MNAIKTSVTYPSGPKIFCHVKDIAVANGAAITSWGEMTQVTASRRPTFVTTGGYNNGKYVKFLKTSSQFLYTTTPITITNSNAGWSCMMVVRAVNVADWERIFHGENNNSRAQDLVNWTKRGTSVVYQMRYAPSGYQPTPGTSTATAYTANVWEVWSMVVNTTSMVVRRNNVTVYNMTGQNFNFAQYGTSFPLNLAFSANIYNVAPSAATSGFTTMDMAAFVMYDRALSGTEVDQLYNYLTTTL